MRKALKWTLLAAAAVALLALPPDSRHFNPAQREGAPHLYNITFWELSNVSDKWTAKAMGLLSGDAAAARVRDTRDYFAVNREMAHVRGRLRQASALDLHDETAKMQALLDDTEAQAKSLSGRR